MSLRCGALEPADSSAHGPTGADCARRRPDRGSLTTRAETAAGLTCIPRRRAWGGHTYGRRVVGSGPSSGGTAAREKGAARPPRFHAPVHPADLLLRRVGIGREPDGRAGGGLPAHLHDVELPVGAGAVRVLRSLFLAGHP